jgi:hypothetical protein
MYLTEYKKVRVTLSDKHSEISRLKGLLNRLGASAELAKLEKETEAEQIAVIEANKN